MTPCKFQTDMTGKAGVLVYSEDREVFATATGKAAKAIRKALDLPRRLGKKYAMARILDDGRIEIGDTLPDQDW